MRRPPARRGSEPSSPRGAPSCETLDALEAVSRAAGPNVEAFVRAQRDTLVREMRSAFDREGAGAAHWLDQRLRHVDRGAPMDQVRCAAIAGLALSLPTRSPSLMLPASIEALFPEALGTMAHYLVHNAHDTGAYDPDCYAKDARLVAGMTVPAGAQVVDIAFPRGPGASLRRLAHMGAMTGRLAMAGAGLDAMAALLGDHGCNDWLEIHTDSRALDDFNEPGWDACYRRVADILALNPDLAGMWGASWFYDPQLVQISPRLAYLQERPLQRGAIAVRLGGGEIHTTRAAQTSPTRAALIARGRYRPVCYAMFWPRKALLDWAARSPKDIANLTL